MNPDERRYYPRPTIKINLDLFTDHEWDLINGAIRNDIDYWQRVVDALPTERSKRMLRELNYLSVKIKEMGK